MEEQLQPRLPVAVIVPCYNAASTLCKTLESALSEGPAEIVAVDDGSRDETLNIARRFEPRVKVLTGPNQGVSAARNKGIASTKAEWLIFVDSDDLLTAGTIPLRFETALATGADVVICDWEDISDDGSGAVTKRRPRTIDLNALQANAEIATATHVWAPPAAVLYRRSIVDKIGGFRADLPVIQDARFLFDAAYHKARFAHLRSTGAEYRITPGSLSRRAPARFWEDVLLNGRQIEALWRADGAWDKERRTALFGIYNNAARGFFEAGHRRYFEAMSSLRELGLPLPRHGQVAMPLAKVFGLQAARSILSLV